MKSNLLANEGVTIPVRTELLAAATADPAAVAEFILSQRSMDGIPALRYWGGTWWLWADGKFSELDNDSVRALVTTAFAGQWSAVCTAHPATLIAAAGFVELLFGNRQHAEHEAARGL